MTGRKHKKVTKLYDRLSAQERVKMLFMADVEGKQADPEIKSSTPQSQIADCNHALGALNSIYNVIGPTAAEVMYRTNILQLQYVIAWTHIRWANDRRRLISGEDPQNDRRVPSNPVGVIDALTPEGKLIPDNELSPLDQITRSYLETIQTFLPKYSREKNAVEQAYGELRSEFGAEDVDDPMVREILDETAQMLVTLKQSSEWLLNLVDEDLHSPDPHFLDLLEQALDAARKTSG